MVFLYCSSLVAGATAEVGCRQELYMFLVTSYSLKLSSNAASDVSFYLINDGFFLLHAQMGPGYSVSIQSLSKAADSYSKLRPQ